MLHMHSGSHTVLIHLFILKGTKLSKYKNAVFMKKKILFEVCRKVKHTCNPVKYLHDRNFYYIIVYNKVYNQFEDQLKYIIF